VFWMRKNSIFLPSTFFLETPTKKKGRKKKKKEKKKLQNFSLSLTTNGSAKWSLRFSSGDFPVKTACAKKPSMANMASRPFLISLTCFGGGGGRGGRGGGEREREKEVKFFGGKKKFQKNFFFFFFFFFFSSLPSFFFFFFFYLELRQRVRVVRQPERVERLPRVQRVQSFPRGTAVDPIPLYQTHQDSLHRDGRDDRLRVHETRVAKIVQPAFLEDGASGLEPDGRVLGEGHALPGEQLGRDAAERAEHGPAGVDDLDLAVAGKGFGVGREAGGVPAVISRVLTVEVRGDGGEGP